MYALKLNEGTFMVNRAPTDEEHDYYVKRKVLAGIPLREIVFTWREVPTYTVEAAIRSAFPDYKREKKSL